MTSSKLSSDLGMKVYCQTNSIPRSKNYSLTFHFFSVDSYDETTNVRSFSYDAMWGSIGGYVGMVLGISLFQLPNLIYGGIQSLKKVTSHHVFSQEETVEPIV